VERERPPVGEEFPEVFCLPSMSASVAQTLQDMSTGNRKCRQVMALATATTKTRLSSHLEDVLAQKLRDGNSALRIWLDSDGVYSGFVERLEGNFFADVVSFKGSYIETIMALEGKAEGLDPEPLLLHLPGHTPESVRETPLLEIYHSGLTFQKNLHTLVKEAAAGVVPPEIIQSEVPSLQTFEQAEVWLENAISRTGAEPAPNFDMPPDDFVYKLFRSPEQILGRPISSDDHDALLDYWSLKTGMLPSIREPLGNRYRDLKMRVVGWLLLVEYAFDLKRDPVGILSAVREQRAFESVCSQCLSRIRDSFSDEYRQIALELETWGPLAEDLKAGSPEELGKVDTFSREDQRLLEAALSEVEAREWQRPMSWAKQRLKARSIWLKREPERERLWRYVLACAELGRLTETTDVDLSSCHDHHEALKLYTSKFHRVDRAHREVEQLYDGLRVHGDLTGINMARDCVRTAYHDWSDLLSRGFNKLCQRLGFLPSSELQQRNLYEDVVHPLVQQSEKTAYFMVDALRYEMATELEERLAGGELTSTLSARFAELPTETRVGMNALAPVARDGRLTLTRPFEGFTYDNFTVNSPKQRLRAMGHRSLDAAKKDNKTPTHFTLKELITESGEEIAARIKKSRMIVVTSGEIDVAGEKDLGFATFDDTLGKIASAVRALHNAGVTTFVLASDHGFGVTNPTSVPISYYNGEPTRRYVLTDGGASVCKDALTVPLRELSYQGVDKVLVLSWDGRAFKCPGKSAETFYHGGNSLQERVIPVLVLQYIDRRRTERPSYQIEVNNINTMPTLAQFSLIVKEAAELESQLLLTEAGERRIRLMFEAVGSGSLALSGTSSGTIENGQLVVSADKPIQSVYVQLSGPVEEIRVSHPDGEYDIQPIAIRLQKPRQEPTLSHDWEDTIESDVDLKILKHIYKHGSISEDEIIELTDNTRAPRRFSKAYQSGGFKNLPFSLRIDTGQGTTYIKE